MSENLKNFLPIAISILSLMLAMFSLGWNIYRDVILKPRVRVSVTNGFTMSAIQDSRQYLFISAVNHGPGKVRLSMIWFRQHGFFAKLRRKKTQGVLLHDWENPLSGKLPITLEVGEKVDLLFPWNKESVLSRSPTHLGLRDSFDRFHWAPRKQIKSAVIAWRLEFGKDQS